MAGNLLRKTKEIEDNVYKIDFGVEDETEIEAENEKKTLKEEAEKLRQEIEEVKKEYDNRLFLLVNGYREGLAITIVYTYVRENLL